MNAVNVRSLFHCCISLCCLSGSQLIGFCFFLLLNIFVVFQSWVICEEMASVEILTYCIHQNPICWWTAESNYWDIDDGSTPVYVCRHYWSSKLVISIQGLAGVDGPWLSQPLAVSLVSGLVILGVMLCPLAMASANSTEDQWAWELGLFSLGIFGDDIQL